MQEIIYLNPIEYLKYKVGSIENIAKILNIHRSTITQWKTRRESHIPAKYIKKILDYSEKNNLCIEECALRNGKKIR